MLSWYLHQYFIMLDIKSIITLFITIVYVIQGAKLFYLSGMLHEEYLRAEIYNLGHFITNMKFRPLIWKATHPYILADRYGHLVGY